MSTQEKAKELVTALRDYNRGDTDALMDAAADELEMYINILEVLVDIVREDTKRGHDPSIYLRGNVWRYHLDRAGNAWEDHPNPLFAAKLTKR